MARRGRAVFGYNSATAKVAELVDALDLGSSAERHGGSSPSFRTRSLLPRAVGPSRENSNKDKDRCSKQSRTRRARSSATSRSRSRSSRSRPRSPPPSKSPHEPSAWGGSSREE